MFSYRRSRVTALTLITSVLAMACSIDPTAPNTERTVMPGAPSATVVNPPNSPDVVNYVNQSSPDCPDEWSACRDLTEDEFSVLYQFAQNLMYSGSAPCQNFALDAFAMLTANPATSKFKVGYGNPGGDIATTYTAYWTDPNFGKVLDDVFVVLSNDRYIPNMIELKNVFVHELFHAKNDFWDGVQRGYDSVYEGYAYGAEDTCSHFM
jgi:hypothetical protein